MGRIKGTIKNGACSSIAQTRAIKASQKEDGNATSSKRGSFPELCSAVVCPVQALALVHCFYLWCTKHFSFRAQVPHTHTSAKATASAIRASQLWNAVKSKCCLMVYFLNTNVKEREKKERVGGMGRREGRVNCFCRGCSFFQKTCHWHLSPENILSCTSVYVYKKINPEKESNQQSSCDRFSDGVLINHTDNEVANCCLIGKLERQLPQ